MTFDFVQLDSATRAIMMSEFDADLADGGPYLSDRLTPAGLVAYPELLREALELGSPESLEYALVGLFNAREPKPSGGDKAVPVNAAAVLAGGEFSRYYARAICIQAIKNDASGSVVVYRARESRWKRPESEALLGAELSAADMLALLRRSRVDPSVDIPAVGSGMSVLYP